MAQSNIRVGGGLMSVRVNWQGVERTESEFKALRRRVGSDTRDVLRVAAEEVVLPVARDRAPAFVRSVLTVGARGGKAYLTTRGARSREARAAGLLEFGGVRRDVIRPRGKRALLFRGGGHPVAVVKGPRRYAGKHFMEGARDERLQSFADRVLKDLTSGLLGD